MALLLCLSMTAALARGCLHCNGNFSEKFSFYRHHVDRKSWWVGDITASGLLLTDWSQDTMKELHLAIPAEITREKLDRVAGAVYWEMDQLYQRKMFFPGYFPSELRAVFRKQVQLIQNAIIESRINCERHCGIFQYKTISCTDCTDSHVVCFGYNCKSSAQWETAVQGLLLYINEWHKEHQRETRRTLCHHNCEITARINFGSSSSSLDARTTPAFLVSPRFACLEPPHLDNLPLENASECLTQH